MKRLVAFMLVALFLAPGIQAQTLQDLLFGEDNEGTTETYRIRDITNTSIGGFTDEFQFLKLHTHEIGPIGTILRVNVQTTFTFLLSSDGAWRYQLFMDGEELEGCGFVVRTHNPGGFLAGDLTVYPRYDVDCTFNGATVESWNESQTIPIEWRRTVLDGAPDIPTQSNVNLVIDREDFIVTNSPTDFEALTGITAGELFVLLGIFFVGIYFWSRSGDAYVRFAMAVLLAVPGTIFVLIWTGGGWMGLFVLGIVALLSSLYLSTRDVLDGLNGKRSN